jgi:hypothetical protein
MTDSCLPHALMDDVVTDPFRLILHRPVMTRLVRATCRGTCLCQNECKGGIAS